MNITDIVLYLNSNTLIQKWTLSYADITIMYTDTTVEYMPQNPKVQMC